MHENLYAHAPLQTAFGENRMAQTTNKRRNALSGSGRKRQEVVKPLVEAIVKIAKDAHSSKVIGMHKNHTVASVGDIDIAIRAPLQLRLSAASERKYSSALFASDPIGIPFQLDVWTTFRKVLNVEYDGGALIIVSFRRGPWEDSLISASKTVSIPCDELFIRPNASIRATQDVPARIEQISASLKNNLK